MRTIAARVTVAAGASIALAGAVVGVVGVVLTDALAREREDARLLDAASTLAIELAEPDASVAWVVADETRELATTGIRVAVHDGARTIAGEALDAQPEPGACVTSGSARVCAVAAAAGLLALAARDEGALLEHRATSMLASALAVLLTSLLGALAARRVALWSVAPLARLTARVSRIDPDAATAESLGAPEGVAEVDALRAALADTLGRLSAALSQARRFAADAAHELRTPLAHVKGELELLAETVSSEADAAAVARARRTADRLATLVERLLVLARPSGTLDRREDVDVRDLVEDLMAELPEPLRRRVSVDVEQGASTQLSADGALIGAMLSSAVENALKFSDDAAPVLVRLSRSDDGALVIDVDDEGPGVPPAERASAFLPFHRSPSARSRGIPGHGLGLSLIAHVVALHGGHVAFADGAPGARLRVVLPRAR